MRVEIARRGRSFLYRLRREDDDPEGGKRVFADCPNPFRLVKDRYTVVPPKGFKAIHPDVHALAVWHTLRPVIGARLVLPFAVSVDLADWLLARHGVRLERADERQRPRTPPGNSSPSLLFSGGMDSMAASLVMPAGTHHLFLDRIPHPCPGAGTSALIDLVPQRAACDVVRKDGRPVHIVADDHESLFSPYPMWHSNMEFLSALYMADSLGLGTIDTGDVLDAKYFRGYHPGDMSRWRMRPPEPMRPPARPRPDKGPGKGGGKGGEFHERVGIRRWASIAGLSEVATTIIVSRSRYRGKSFSCYYPTKDSFCLRCDKCFKKLLLRHIADGKEVPEELFESFLVQPHLGAIFSRPYFDWHHVWFYLFQHIRCRHWFARELQRQAREGPDLSCLEKWYPKAAGQLGPGYADIVLGNIARFVKTMSAAEVTTLEADIPPLRAPPLKKPASGKAAIPSPSKTAEGPVLSRASAPEIPPAIKALAGILRGKLMRDPPPRWGGYDLAEVFLRPGEACVWLKLRAAGGKPGDGEILARLFRIDGGQDHFAARLGVLGISFRAGARIEQPLVDGLLRGLAGVLSQAARDISPAPPGGNTGPLRPSIGESAVDDQG